MRTAIVKAISPSTLLRLRRKGVLLLAKVNPELREVGKGQSGASGVIVSPDMQADKIYKENTQKDQDRIVFPDAVRSPAMKRLYSGRKCMGCKLW